MRKLLSFWTHYTTFIVVMLAILGAGVFFTLRAIKLADLEMRAKLLQQIRLVTQSLDVERIQALTGTEADLASPDYQLLKEQLFIIRQANPNCRFFYLMGRKTDGTVFFFVDSEPSDSKDYSPPGQIYTEVSEETSRVFTSQTAGVQGPTTDCWGTWISGLVPITDSQTVMDGPATSDDIRVVRKAGGVLAVLGMDIDARAWNRSLFCAALPTILLTLALASTLLIGLIFSVRRSRSALASSHWIWHLEVALVVAVGLSLTLFAAWTVHEEETRDRKMAFEQLAQSQIWAIADTICHLSTELDGLGSFYEGSMDVTSKEFEIFTHHLMKSSAIQSWEWIQIVPASAKTQFEEAARAEGLTGFEIWQKDGQGKRIPASGRMEYFPVFRVAPLAGNEDILGYDYGSEPLRRAAIEEAARTDLTTCTAPITLVQETGKQKGIMICQSVLASNDPSRCGFALAVVRMENLIKNVSKNTSLLMELSILRKDLAPEPIAFSWNASPLPAGFTIMRPVFAFGKVFAVTAHEGPNFVQMYPIRAGWLAMLIGLVLTIASAVVIHMTLGRREELERLVAGRTLELRESEQSYRLLAENVKDVIWIIDVETMHFLYVSPSVERLRGYTAKEIVAEPVTKALTPDAADYLINLIRSRTEDVISGRESSSKFYTNEVEQPCKDGSTVWTEVITNYYINPKNGRPEVRGVTRDITERRKAEAEREKLEAELRQSQKMEAVGRLAGGVAHDFNNMLLVILGYAEGLLEKVDPAQSLHADLEEIMNAGRRSRDLVRQLLAFARKQIITPKVLDLNDAVAAILKMLERIIGENIELVWNPAPDLWKIKVDPSQLDQIMANLLVNARDAISGPGKVVIETGTAELDEDYCKIHIDSVPGKYVVLSVSDNGCGMDKETCDHIFEPFFTTKEVGEGTGLGLATVFGIVKQNNGYISVSSEPGKGTTFKIYLPRHEPGI